MQHMMMGDSAGRQGRGRRVRPRHGPLTPSRNGNKGPCLVCFRMAFTHERKQTFFFLLKNWNQQNWTSKMVHLVFWGLDWTESSRYSSPRIGWTGCGFLSWSICQDFYDQLFGGCTGNHQFLVFAGAAALPPQARAADTDPTWSSFNCALAV